MLLFDFIAEQRIAEAIERGELSGLPGEGKPLYLDDDALIPEDLRMAWRILKNAGFVPPEVEALREIGELERLIESLSDGEARNAATRKLQLLRMRMEPSCLAGSALRPGQPYLQRVLERLDR